MGPRIQYAKTSDGVSIAFWTLGKGEPSVHMPAFPWSHIQLEWQMPALRHLYSRLAQRGCTVGYDARGTGSSDRKATDFSLDAHLLDLEAVVDRLQLDRFALLGRANSAPVAVAYAVRNPERVSRLVLFTPHPGGQQLYKGTSSGRAFGALREIDFRILTETVAHELLGWEAGEAAGRMAAFMRECTSQEVALASFRTVEALDVDDLLTEVQPPTLVLALSHPWWPPVEAARSVAARIPDARLVVVDWTAGVSPYEDTEAAERMATAITEFLDEGEEAAPEPAPAEAGAFRTILFTDIEGSTAMTQRLGDARAREVLREHEGIVREALKAHGGSEVKTMGDGFMASFGSAVKALECAIAIQRAFEARNASLPAHPEALEGRAEPQPSAHPFDSAQDRASTGSARADRGVSASSAGEAIRVRIGLNAGEPIAEDEDLFGTAVIRAARIAALAQGGEILAANVVRELAEGKGFLFGDRGEAALRGFDDPVRLFEVRWRESAGGE